MAKIHWQATADIDAKRASLQRSVDRRRQARQALKELREVPGPVGRLAAAIDDLLNADDDGGGG